MEYELMRALEFISAKWAEFEAFCEDNGDNPDDLIDVLEKNQQQIKPPIAAFLTPKQPATKVHAQVFFLRSALDVQVVLATEYS